MKLLLENWRKYVKESSDTEASFELSPEEAEYHKARSSITEDDLRHILRIYEKYKALIYGGQFVSARGQYLKRSPYSKLTYRGRRQRAREVIKFYNEDLIDTASMLVGISGQIEKGNFNGPRPHWILKMNKKFESALSVAKKFIRQRTMYEPGEEEAKLKRGLSDMEKFMDDAHLREGILDFTKDRADIDGEALKDIFQTQLAADDLERLIGDAHSSKRKPHPQHIKSLLEKMLRLYEEKIDPLLSQMMVVKSQIERGSHSWPLDLSRSLESGFGGVMKHKLDAGPQAAIEHALKVLLRARGQMLELYRKNRGYAGLPAYEPSASMHDLAKLMGQAKERE